MTISIITATFNSEETVRDTLLCVRNQDYRHVEHLIIDGYSQDGTLKIVQSFPHVSKTIVEKDNGIYDAMNKGIKAATGEVIGILNSDDIYASDSVLGQVAEVFATTDCDAVYGDLVYVDREDISKVLRYWKAGKYRMGSFKWGWMPPHPTFFVRKDVYMNFGMFQIDLKTAADYELMLRLVHKHGIKVSYLPGVMVRMRSGGASNASLSKRLVANKYDREAWKRNGIRPFWFTLYLKPARKIGQFLIGAIYNFSLFRHKRYS